MNRNCIGQFAPRHDEREHREMRVLVGITCYGTRNLAHARRLIAAYRSMPFDIELVMLSEAPKDVPADVTLRVGLPTRDPWSLGFAHKRLFADNASEYDLFIYSEDDIFVSAENILAFMKAAQMLEGDLLPGFLRFERHLDGTKNYPDIHGPYHWVPDSVRRSGDYVHARLSNDHSACYMLTKAHLEKAIASGGFLVPPHQGRYDLLCSAATDPYTQCGFTRVVCLSHLTDFEVHHLSDAYVHGHGLVDNDGAVVDGPKQQSMSDAMVEVLERKRPREALFATRKGLPTPLWDKNYYESARTDLLALLPPRTERVLSVGCGWGATEAELVRRCVSVTAIPLDAVIGRLAEARGVEIVEPDFERAFRTLGQRRFDAILVSEVLQHVADPVALLRQLKGFLAASGAVVGSVPNLCPLRRWCGSFAAKNSRRFRVPNDFGSAGLNLTSMSAVRGWLAASGLSLAAMSYGRAPGPAPPRHRWISSRPGSIMAADVLFVAR
jgi:SAM-dependent methyltransferase